ncbi:hypothetical protein [Empedobacter tilapiae]
MFGKYSLTNTKTYDSIYLNKNNTFIHIIHNSSGKLVLKEKGNWKMISDNRIELNMYYNNGNNDINKYLNSEFVNKIKMISSFPIYYNNDLVIIEVDGDSNLSYIKKQK